MRPQTSGDRYILYLPATVEQHRRLDGSLQKQVDDEISKFFDAWNVADVPAKHRGPIGQVKNDRNGVRAFASHWNGGDVHVILIHTIYKKNQARTERKEWAALETLKEEAHNWQERFDERQQNDQLDTALENLRENDDYRLRGPDSY